MKTRVRSFFLFLGLLALAAIPADAAPVPGVINVQGVLRDSAGVLKDGMFTMTFRLYDAESGGTMLWQEVQPDVPVVNGVFFAFAGSLNVIDPAVARNATSLWLGVTVQGDPVELPRQRLGSVPFAMKAEIANVASDAQALGGVDPSGWQRRQTVTCPLGQYLRGLNADGSPVCTVLPGVYVVTVSPTVACSSSVAVGNASCNAGDTLVGGGCGPASAYPMLLMESYPTGTAWRCEHIMYPGSNCPPTVTLAPYAICQDTTP